MPYAVDNDRFGAQVDRRRVHELRERWGATANRGVILFGGKLEERKLPDVLLQAWRQANWPGEQPVLIFAGDGVMRQGLIAASDGEDAVHFLGFVNHSDLACVCAAADVFVLAARHEPWGLAVNEAMACATPVVVSGDVGAAPDLVDDETGRIVMAGDVQALADALVTVLADSERMGRCAQEKVHRLDFGHDLDGLERAIRFVQVAR